MNEDSKPDYCKKNEIDCYKCEFYVVAGCTLNDSYKQILDDILSSEGDWK